MRFLSTLLGITLGAGTLPGSADEARDYALRESFSPGVQEFVGGDTISLGGLLLFLLVVLVIIWIAKEI
jgi:hypothetical protein